MKNLKKSFLGGRKLVPGSVGKGDACTWGQSRSVTSQTSQDSAAREDGLLRNEGGWMGYARCPLARTPTHQSSTREHVPLFTAPAPTKMLDYISTNEASVSVNVTKVFHSILPMGSVTGSAQGDRATDNRLGSLWTKRRCRRIRGLVTSVLESAGEQSAGRGKWSGKEECVLIMEQRRLAVFSQQTMLLRWPMVKLLAGRVAAGRGEQRTSVNCFSNSDKTSKKLFFSNSDKNSKKCFFFKQWQNFKLEFLDLYIWDMLTFPGCLNER